MRERKQYWLRYDTNGNFIAAPNKWLDIDIPVTTLAPDERVIGKLEMKHILERLVFNKGYAITADELAHDLMKELFAEGER